MAEPALRLAVIGDPVEHSLSPFLHRGFLEAAGLQGSYEAIRVPAGEGARAIDALRALGYTGLNVTTPLKEEAFARAERRDEAAETSGSVNTLLLEGERIEGYNTDGAGALGALKAAGLEGLDGRAILVLGAGPTARAATVALRRARAMVFLWNRTKSRAKSLAASLGLRLWAQGTPLDAVLSTLPPDAALEPRLTAALRAAPLVIDANYGPRSTLGAALGRSDLHDGRAMLAAGARASFELFRARSQVHR